MCPWDIISNVLRRACGRQGVSSSPWKYRVLLGTQGSGHWALRFPPELPGVTGRALHSGHCWSPTGSFSPPPASPGTSTHSTVPGPTVCWDRDRASFSAPGPGKTGHRLGSVLLMGDGEPAFWSEDAWLRRAKCPPCEGQSLSRTQPRLCISTRHVCWPEGPGWGGDEDLYFPSHKYSCTEPPVCTAPESQRGDSNLLPAHSGSFRSQASTTRWS